MRKIVQCSFIFALLNCNFSLSAQSPAWTNFGYRQQMFPESQYLVGFSSGNNSQAENVADLQQKHIEIAQKELVNAIYTIIQSKSTLDIENTNAQTHEVYRLQSSSSSKAHIAGLTIKKHYDPERKNIFAFAYAKKSEVIALNKKTLLQKKVEVVQKLEEAQRAAVSGNKRDALKYFYKARNMLTTMDEAQALLLAMGIEDAATLQTAKINTYKAKVNQGISGLQSNQQLTLEEVAYFMAYACFLQTDQLAEEILLEDFTYQFTGMSSNFSKRFASSFEKHLIEVGKYNVIPAKETSFKDALRLSGTYWQEGNRCKIFAVLRSPQTGQTLASLEGNLPLESLSQRGLAYIPANYQKIQQINSISLKVNPASIEVKITELLQNPLQVTAHFNSPEGNSGLHPNLPLEIYRITDNLPFGFTQTNNAGKATLYLEGITVSEKPQIIGIRVDLARWLGIDTTSSFYKQIIKEYTLPQTRIVAHISGPSIYMEATEAGTEIPYIESGLKKALTQKSFTFTNNLSEANYYIKLDALSRNGSSLGNLHFAYVDAEVSIMNLTTGQEIFTNAFGNIKGGGGDFQKAKVKAFQKAVVEVANSVIKHIIQEN